MAKSTTPKKLADAPVKAPSHLSTDSKAFFNYVIHEYLDFDQHHIRLLTLACEAWDRSVQARKLIEKDGLTFVDRHGAIKPHAAVAIEKDSRIAFARMIREIGLDVTDTDSSRLCCRRTGGKHDAKKTAQRLQSATGARPRRASMVALQALRIFKFKPAEFLREFWSTHGDSIVYEHVAEFPGTRPARWWGYNAPRSPIDTYPGCFYDGKLPEPRKWLGGVGTPDYEVLAVVPSFSFGIPTFCFGQKLKPESAGIDPENPPLFESQASYPERHGLFLPGERKRLKANDWEAERVC